MARFLLFCLLALCFLLVAASGSPGALQPVLVETVSSPARFAGSIPLSVAPTRSAGPPTIGQRAVRLAARELGTPYRYGGSSPSGFDCSGLVAYVYGKLGVRLPHNAAAQYAFGRAVDRRELQPGDLVFFHGLGHVGLYIGHGRIIHAPQSGERVEIQALAARRGSVEGARRIAPV